MRTVSRCVSRVPLSSSTTVPVRTSTAIAPACEPTARMVEKMSDPRYGRRKPSKRKKVLALDLSRRGHRRLR